MALIDSLIALYNEAYENREPLCDGYPLLDSPVGVLTIVAVYLMVVWQGPKLMQHRRPVDLKGIIIVYNIVMVFVSAFICFGGIYAIVCIGGLKVFCEGSNNTFNFDDEKRRYYYVNLAWLFFISKLVEFLDTVFFIVRKKNNHVSFLHVYHHTTTALFTWTGLKFFTGGNNIVYGVVNSFIHVVMYTYYALAAFGPEMTKYLWWKKYLTRLQISQFMIFITYGLWNEIYGCPFSKTFVYLTFVHIFIILLLFINFYVQCYNRAQVKARAKVNGRYLRAEELSNVGDAVKKLN
ncbi:elongation of very long chain fatty acids protein 4-like [Physella acuta]|uniref:elongation of very long chain fatty acids protein 4-like n=1 Tax=Physella acuta TaxID=109671 RepID=UPI0027DC9AB9|nr:elongation of very long chain fatty acids protein 4-like [Physella acuta]